MSTQVFTNISLIAGAANPQKILRGHELSLLNCIENGYIIVDNGEISETGSMQNFKYERNDVPPQTMVLPAWCDCHSHIVFAGSREAEFIDKIKGLSYTEIAAKGGGILNSAKKLANTSEDELFNSAWKRLAEVSKMGTGAIEIKSGYGLSIDAELKMLRVIKRLKEKSALKIKATFLGAHAIPESNRENREDYIQDIIGRMLPVIAKEKLADYIDVFCEKGFFTPEEMVEICTAGKQYGLKPKLHVNQMSSIGGIEAGMDLGALSLDHLETLTPQDIELLGTFEGASVLLPSAAFFLRMNMPPSRELIKHNAAVTLASDYNPGSSPSGNMNLVIALACIQMKMLPSEAINAATINGAFAMEIEKDFGSIFSGKKANLIFTKPVPSLSYLPYSFGQNHIDKVMINGNFI